MLAEEEVGTPGLADQPQGPTTAWEKDALGGCALPAPPRHDPSALSSRGASGNPM